MNAYKYQAYIGIKETISILNRNIEGKEADIAQKKGDIELLEKEIMECKGRLALAINFKNELEKGEKTFYNDAEIDCNKRDGNY